LAGMVLIYAFYHLWMGHYLPILPSIVLSCVCLAQAFRYHFWYVQLKIGKLGCTFDDWLDYMKASDDVTDQADKKEKP